MVGHRHCRENRVALLWREGVRLLSQQRKASKHLPNELPIVGHERVKEQNEDFWAGCHFWGDSI
eukprot:7383976-Prymnesium_polylepis.1